jgi:uncharacterized protein (TIGR00304 family)
VPDWTFLIIAGSFVIILGFLLVAFGMKEASDEEKPAGTGKTKVKGGGVILIGPIPVVFGTDKKSALLMMILAIVLMLLLIVFLK